jgi:hypothetical protein
MVRDPRDTVVSYYFQRTLRSDRYSGSMAGFIRDPSYGIERIVQYNLAWLKLGTDLPAFLPISYENLKFDPVAVMNSIVGFVGAELPRSDIERVCRNNTFEKMRTREASGEYKDLYKSDARYRRMLRPTSDNPESYKVRRGKVGGYADYLTAEDIIYCDNVLSRHSYFDRLDKLNFRWGL